MVFQLCPLWLIRKNLLDVLVASPSLVADHVALPQTPATALRTPEDPAPVLPLNVLLRITPPVVEFATQCAGELHRDSRPSDYPGR